MVQRTHDCECVSDGCQWDTVSVTMIVIVTATAAATVPVGLGNYEYVAVNRR